MIWQMKKIYLRNKYMTYFAEVHNDSVLRFLRCTKQGMLWMSIKIREE